MDVTFGQFQRTRETFIFGKEPFRNRPFSRHKKGRLCPPKSRMASLEAGVRSAHADHRAPQTWGRTVSKDGESAMDISYESGLPRPACKARDHTGGRSDRLVNELSLYQIQVNRDIASSEGARDSSATCGGPGGGPARPIPTWIPRVVRLSYTSCGSVRKRGLVLPPLHPLTAPAFRR